MNCNAVSLVAVRRITLQCQFSCSGGICRPTGLVGVSKVLQQPVPVLVLVLDGSNVEIHVCLQLLCPSRMLGYQPQLLQRNHLC